MGKLPDHYPDVGPGWSAILTMLHAELAQIAPEYEVLQVKEKFGGLRMYINIPGERARPFSRPAYYLIHRYETFSLSVCEFCGKQGECKANAHGWYKTFCETHRRRQEEEGPITGEG